MQVCMYVRHEKSISMLFVYETVPINPTSLNILSKIKMFICRPD